MSRGKIVGDGPNGQYKIGATLGKGAFSTVYNCVRLCDGAVFAVKVMSKLDMRRDPDLEDALCREINSMEAIRHSQFITNMIDKLVSPRNYYIVMDLASGGSLQQLLQKHSGGLHPNRARLYFRQLLLGLGAIHQSNVVHRDIKLENLLLDATKTNLKVSDFGFACYSGPQRELRRKCGTTRYTAPELYLQETYFGRDVDVWAAGVSLYVMLFNCYPFGARQDDTQTVIDKICRGKLTFPRRTSSSLEHLLRVILRVNPKKRWKLEQIKSHAWVMGIDEVTITLPKTLLVANGPHLPVGRGGAGATPPSSCGSGTPKPFMVGAAAAQHRPLPLLQQQEPPFPTMGASPNSGLASGSGSLAFASSPNDEPDSRYLLQSSLLEDAAVAESMEALGDDDEGYLTGGSHRRVRSCPVLPSIFFESCNNCGTCGAAEEGPHHHHPRFLSTADASILSASYDQMKSSCGGSHHAEPLEPSAAEDSGSAAEPSDHPRDDSHDDQHPQGPHHQHHHHHNPHHTLSAEHQRWQVQKALWLADLHTKPSSSHGGSGSVASVDCVPFAHPPPAPPTTVLQLHSFAGAVGDGSGAGTIGTGESIGLATSASAAYPGHRTHHHFARDDAFFTDMPSSQRRRTAVGVSSTTGMPSVFSGAVAAASPSVTTHGRRDVPPLRPLRRSPPAAPSTTPHQDRTSGSPTSSSPFSRWDRSSSTPPYGSNHKDGTPQAPGSAGQGGDGKRFVRNSLWSRLSMVHVKIFVNFCVFCIVLLIVGALRVLFDVDARKLPIPSFLRDVMERVLAPPFERDGDSLGTAGAPSSTGTGGGGGPVEVPTLAAAPTLLSRSGGRAAERTTGSDITEAQGSAKLANPLSPGGGVLGGSTLRRRRPVDTDDSGPTGASSTSVASAEVSRHHQPVSTPMFDSDAAPTALGVIEALTAADGTPSKRRVRITTPSSSAVPPLNSSAGFSDDVPQSADVVHNVTKQSGASEVSCAEGRNGRKEGGEEEEVRADDGDDAAGESMCDPCPGTSGMRQVVSRQTIDDLADLEDELI